MIGRWIKGVLRLAVLGAAVMFVANLAFTMARLVDTKLPRDRTVLTLRTAFDRGTLGDHNYPQDLMAGLDQASDCTTLQLMLPGQLGAARNAFAPRLLSPDQPAADSLLAAPPRCRELREVLDGAGPRAGPVQTALWHGQASVAAIALAVLPVDGYRALLATTTMALIAGLAVAAALAGRGVLLGLSAMLVGSFFMSAQLGFGQSIALGPAQIALWTMALLLVLARRSIGPRGILLLAVLGGALDAFLDPMIASPLALAVFLVTAAAISVPRWRAGSLLTAVVEIVVFAVGWMVSLFGTYVVKLMLVVAMFGPGVVLPIAGARLSRWAAESFAGILGLPGAVLKLCGEMWNLGYMSQGSRPVAAVIVMLGLTGWTWAGLRLIEAVQKGRVRDMLMAGLGHLAACTVALAWIAAYSAQIDAHAWHIVRVAAIGIWSGYGWALTDYAVTRPPVRRLGRA